MSRVRTRVLLALLVASGACACGSPGEKGSPGWYVRAVPEETIVAGVRAHLRVEDFVPSPQDVFEVLAVAKRVQPIAQVDSLVATRSHPGERRHLAVRFAPHEVTARVRWIHILSFERRGPEDASGEATGPWQADKDMDRIAQICGPGRSFHAGGTIQAAEILEVWIARDVPTESVLPILDAAKAQVPPGEVPSGLTRDGEGYELTTVHGDDLDGLSGSTLGITRDGTGWRAEVTGRWVS